MLRLGMVIWMAAAMNLIAVVRPPSASAEAALATATGEAGVGRAASQSSNKAPPGEATDQGDPTIAEALGAYGDLGGLRAFLQARGLTYDLILTAEALENPTGGIRQGIVGEGLLDLRVDVDLKKLCDLNGATLHANAFKIFGDGLSRSDLLNVSLTSGIEALPSTRLYEAWFEQQLLDGKAAVKIGQIGASYEFLVSRYADHFVNSTFYWTDLANYDLPSGGPSYPLATPGIRIRVSPDDHWTLLTGLFDGDSAGVARFGPGVNAQKLDRYGTDFRLTDPPLFISEAAFNYGDKAGGVLPGTVKLGAWENFGSFPNAIPTSAGLTLGSGAGSGRLRGDDGVYGMIDQMVYRPKDVDDGSVGVFARLSGAPGDRNLISFYADAGILGKGVVPGRPDDATGVSFAYAEFSSATRRTDRLEEANLGVPYPIRSNELVFEATYQAQVAPGFTLQPDLQYIVRPGGGIPTPLSANIRQVPDAAVVGLRAMIRY